MNVPNEKKIAELLIKNETNMIDSNKVYESIENYNLIWKLRKIGEYSAAVDYLAKSFSEHNDRERSFTEFCLADFENRMSYEQKVAKDTVEIVKSLKDERHFVFYEPQSTIGKKLISKINNEYACARALRYNELWRVISMYESANISDIGCGEARFEEHCNILNKCHRYHFNVADRSSYILIQAKYRNRLNNNITYFLVDFSKEFDLDCFKFQCNSNDPLIVVVSEFIEHLSKSKAQQLLKGILSNIKPKELLITTPNHDYSSIYKKNDPNNLVHVFEYGYNEFKTEMKKLEVYASSEYVLSECFGIAGKKDLPQSLFAGFSFK